MIAPSALYGAVAHLRNALYDRGVLPVRHLHGPVVSVGNLSVGGSGKTPFIILLGELLQQRGIAFDVLSRGYGRRTKGVAIVDPEGSAADFGDEPLLIARRLGANVIVGEDRYQAGVAAEKRWEPNLHLLDDGFQHRRLARQFDIVLASSADVQDSLLPGGRLREPLSSLSRADAVVLTNDDSAGRLDLAKQLVWHVRRGIVPPKTPEPCFAFCGIARPENFFAQLQAAEIVLADTRTFRDHHRYTDADIQQLLRLRQQSGAPAFATTEKDAVNLGMRLGALRPLHVVPVRMQMDAPDAALDAMLTTIAKRKPSAA